VCATPEQITSGAPLSGIDIGLWEHATAQQGSHLWRIDLVILGLTPVNGFHIESMTQNKGNVLFGTQVGEPIPGAEAFNRHDQPLTIGGNGLEEGFRSGFHITVQKDFTVVTQDADVHGTGMQVDTAVKRVWMGVESHEVSSFVVNLVFPPLAYHWGMLRGRPHTLSRVCSRLLEASPVKVSITY
jgi:hypothetical protein